MKPGELSDDERIANAVIPQIGGYLPSHKGWLKMAQELTARHITRILEQTYVQPSDSQH